MSGSPAPSAADAVAWSVRRFVYATLVVRGVPPSVPEIAQALGRAEADIAVALRTLHERHAPFVEGEGDPLRVRMAHPFSGVTTEFVVRANGLNYWANCAWDALGIPAALGASAEITARRTDDGTPVRLRIADGRLQAAGELVHFLVPFRRWYDDLVIT